MKKHPDGALPLAAIQCIVTGLAILAITSVSYGALPWDLPWNELMPGGAPNLPLGASEWTLPVVVFWTGIVGTAMTVYFQANIFKHLPAVDASVILTMEPL